jgi:[glutamine synthetase] adenylyltransferase / [glutamine synthetase]-adenylyl-L-tyrosine phosphorylase
MPGGLVDIEFIVHMIQLKTGDGLHPQLPRAIAALVAAGHLTPGFADGNALMSRLLILVRLICPDCDIPSPAAQILIARSLGFDDWRALIAALDGARHIVSTTWNALLGPRNF